MQYNNIMFCSMLPLSGALRVTQITDQI